MGRIEHVRASDKGIHIQLDTGGKLLLPYTVMGPEDISEVLIASEGRSILMQLRNGESLEYSLARIRALAETLEERLEGADS